MEGGKNGKFRVTGYSSFFISTRKRKLGFVPSIVSAIRLASTWQWLRTVALPWCYHSLLAMFENRYGFDLLVSVFTEENRDGWIIEWRNLIRSTLIRKNGSTSSRFDIQLNTVAIWIFNSHLVQNKTTENKNREFQSRLSHSFFFGRLSPVDQTKVWINTSEKKECLTTQITG